MAAFQGLVIRRGQHRRMIALAFRHRLAQVLDVVAQGGEFLAIGQHDGVVEPLAPAVALSHVAASFSMPPALLVVVDLGPPCWRARRMIFVGRVT